MGGIFLRTSHGVRRTSAAIPHPGMADTYGCPLENLPKLHTRVYQQTVSSPKNKQTANGHSCRA